MDLEGTMLREVTQRKRNTIGFHSYMESNKPNKTKKSHRYRDQRSDYLKGRGRGWMKWGKGVNCLMIDGN